MDPITTEARGASWSGDRDQTSLQENGSMGGSRHKEQGRRPSSAGRWSRPWALLDEKLRMQCWDCSPLSWERHIHRTRRVR